MPFAPAQQCLVCLRIKGGDKQLLERINRSRAFTPTGEPLTHLSKDIGISYTSVYNHAQKHQAPNAKTLAKRVQRHETKEALKEITSEGTQKKLSAYTAGNSGGARAELIDKLLDMADKGELKMSGTNLVSLLSQAQKEEEAAKDRQFELMKMFSYFNAQAGNPADYKKYSEAEEGEIA